MAPTLPTELIKHILELLYDDVRSPGYRSTTPFDPMEGEKLPFVFRPFFLVSKTFYALALSLAARHLFRSKDDDRATQTLDKLYKALAHLSDQGLGKVVESICLLTGVKADEEAECFKAFPCLRTLQAFDFIKNPVNLPSTLTTLVLQAGGTFKSTALKALALATPHLTALSLSGQDETGNELPLCLEASPDVFTPNWRLQHLAFHYIAGSVGQALAFVTSSSATLQSLKFTLPAMGQWVAPPIIPSDCFNHLDHPLPVLRRLDLGEEHPLSRASTALDRSLLPSLEDLTLPVSRRSIHQILTLSPTLSHVSLITVDLKLKASSPFVLDTLKTFIKGRPALRVLSVDCSNSTKTDSYWYEEIKAECEELDITFASSSLGMDEAEMWTEEEYSGKSETENEIKKRRKREDEALPLDFDAEDDEMWAPNWSEKKRKEMGYDDGTVPVRLSLA